MSKPKIVVLGAGYAGMMTTKRLTQKLRPEEAELVLVNKHNYHYQTTWLHQVAAGTVNQNQARMMISDVINPNRVNLIYDEVVEVKKEENRVVLKNSEITYDYLVISLGFETNTFGIKGMEKNAFSITDIESSRMIREHIEYQFAKYSTAEKPNEDDLAILVGGGGFTGIEFVGELAEKVPELCKKYDIDRSKVRIINVEAAPRIMPGFDDELVAYAKRSLEDRGVEFREGAKINECKKNSFVIGDDNEEIKAGTIVWTGGVTGSSILSKSGFEITKGKVTVDGDMRAPGEENIFILGDCAWVMNEAEGKPFPPTAQAAMQHAETCSDNLKALLHHEPMKKFVFDDKGTVASLGETDAMGTVFNDNKLYGKPAVSMKKVVDNRYLFLLGGPKLILKKGKLRML
ncbi:NAD(P)/FAD-dependent oxidoreductase [Lentibacillus cibarius]|uniref:NAD(P)/FAD-dependent oxidoreductase n=1 Tax=Lentibacillus cibarius TaxID=2583219 RepID=A0A549YK05_9BACI|nr:NAD(P)/FAD-dependent oxidoreductase [Lentibacillus cibarius]TMN23393.1 NAD(P)/FAD-dependent oxidoreductase [Lentibacillus cibarius]TRM12202.1 NAD(P)/FAD-dependent oxidoreductase [Lentibacillus cibarius]